MNEYAQWAALIVVFLVACAARGSAVREARRLVAQFDVELGAAFEQAADQIAPDPPPSGLELDEL